MHLFSETSTALILTMKFVAAVNPFLEINPIYKKKSNKLQKEKKHERKKNDHLSLFSMKGLSDILDQIFHQRYIQGSSFPPTSPGSPRLRILF